MNIVWFSEIKWDYLRTRKQQLISRKPDDIDLVYFEPYVKGRKNQFHLHREGNIRCATVPFVKAAPSQMWKILLGRKMIRRMVGAAAHSHVKKLLNRIGWNEEEVGCIISNIYGIRSARILPRRFLLYDYNDAHDAFPGMPSWAEEYFLETCTHADAVTASSRVLYETASRIRGENRCRLIGNGVNYDHFASDDGVVKARAHLARPCLGYIGAIAPWLDFDALQALTERHPEWDIMLVGPVFPAAGGRVQRLADRPNVRLCDPVSYEKVPEVLRQFSIGLIPFRYNKLTRGVNPNKMYEYLASGLPVVATSFSHEVRQYPEVVRSVDGVETFIESCEAMVEATAEEGNAAAFAEKARRIAKENDWSVIAEAFWETVKRLMTGNLDVFFSRRGET